MGKSGIIKSILHGSKKQSFWIGIKGKGDIDMVLKKRVVLTSAMDEMFCEPIVEEVAKYYESLNIAQEGVPLNIESFFI